MQILDEIVGRRMPSTSATRWNFRSRLVETVFEYRELLYHCFEQIEISCRQTSTISQARGLKLKISQSDFLFWLHVFHMIMPHVEILYNQLQKRSIDAVTAKKAIQSFEEIIKDVRDNIDSIAKNYSQQESKKRRQDDHKTRNIAAKEVCDVILFQAKERFSFNQHLIASNLFNSGNFPEFHKTFPETTVRDTCAVYPFLDRPKLRTELEVVYMRGDFRNVCGATDLLAFIIENNLQKTFSETAKLLKVLITIPMTTSEAERCF